jgi:hypothetical protein
MEEILNNDGQGAEARAEGAFWGSNAPMAGDAKMLQYKGLRLCWLSERQKLASLSNKFCQEVDPSC